MNVQTATSMITSAGGNIIVHGEGGGSGTSNVNYGISLSNGVIHAIGNGSIEMIGMGGTSSGGSNAGISAVGVATVISTVMVISRSMQKWLLATGTLNHV